ncbi:MAG: DUF4381 family protein [Saccharospirillum sp.]
MATALNAPANPALAELLGQLAPNMAPAEAGVWPLAPLYWLLLGLVVGLLGAITWWFWRHRQRRRFARALKRLARIDDPARQLQQLHALLRNAAGLRDPAWRSLSDRAFGQAIAAELGLEQPPAWVNAHYRPDPQPGSAFVDADQLLRRWCT